MNGDHADRHAGDPAGANDPLDQELSDALESIGLESLMELDAATPRAAAPASASGVRHGRVLAIHGEDIFVDMGGKSQGVLSTAQFMDKPLPAVGDIIEVVIEGYDRSDGLLLLSREGAVKAAAWETIAEGQIVEGRVTGHNKGGLELDIQGIRAFMPASQIEMFRTDDLAQYVNQRLTCEVTDVDRADKNVVVSRRNVLEREAAEAREQAFASLVEGRVVSGVVKTIMPYGAFVDVGGVDGLLHVKDMKHGRTDDPRSVVKEGQRLEVMVLRVDRDTRKISLGLKQVLADPWQDAESKWPVESIVTGRVTKLMEFGAFVELEDGIEGLIPISELTYERRVRHPSEIVKEGDVVRVRVKNIDLERKRISLSLKQVGDDPWIGASARWREDSVIEGTVTRITDFGAFVELTAGVEGLVHISELSDQRVRTVRDVVKEGQSVRAVVLSVDEDARRISLSIKKAAAADMPLPEATPGTPETPKPKRKKPLKGGLDW